MTEQHVGTGMSLSDLCDAAVRFSDNTAANLVLEELRGPPGAQAALGDQVTNVNRTEPELNRTSPGDERDTSTAAALAADLERLTIGDGLDAPEQDQLVGWLRRNTTGDDLIRSVVPAAWPVGDKTGTADYGTRNDIAVAWPHDGAPIVIAMLTTHDDPSAAPSDALVADAASIALAALGVQPAH